MKYFLELIEVVKSRGINYMDQRADKISVYNPESLFWQFIENCKPFVFSKEEQFEQTITDLSLNTGGFDINPDIDAPFKIFSIEVIDGYLSIDHIKDPEADRIVKTKCILVVENNPKEYAYFTLTEQIGPKFKPGFSWVIASNVDGPIVNHFLNRLSREKLGAENCRVAVKLGTGKNKRKHRIRQIIHVSPQKTINKTILSHRNVDWTHRFEVRGHWRKHDGLGKDREGKYCVSGFTWVSDYIKGPENLPLITKTRMVGD